MSESLRVTLILIGIALAVVWTIFVVAPAYFGCLFSGGFPVEGFATYACVRPQ